MDALDDPALLDYKNEFFNNAPISQIYSDMSKKIEISPYKGTSFFWPFIVLGARNPTLPVALQLLQASYFKDYSLIMAGVVVATVPLLVLFVIAGRQLVSGIMQGAVKG